jgi:hypothetical protein
MGALCARTLREKRGEGETSQADTPERKNRRYTYKLLGSNSLKERAM